MPLNEDKLTPRQKGYIEGFACALQRIQYAIMGDCGVSKSYDPMTIEGNTMHSYAFNLKDGGRHHPLSDYESANEICELLFSEILDELRENEVKLFDGPIDDPRFSAKA